MEIDVCTSRRRIKSQSMTTIYWWKKVYVLLISRYKMNFSFLKVNEVAIDSNSFQLPKYFQRCSPSFKNHAFQNGFLLLQYIISSEEYLPILSNLLFCSHAASSTFIPFSTRDNTSSLLARDIPFFPLIPDVPAGWVLNDLDSVPECSSDDPENPSQECFSGS